MKNRYIIRLNAGKDPPLYYNRDSSWMGVPKAQATKLKHKEALLVRNVLKRAGYRPTIEE